MVATRTCQPQWHVPLQVSVLFLSAAVAATLMPIVGSANGDVALDAGGSPLRRHPLRPPLPPPVSPTHRTFAYTTAADPTQECADMFGNACAECCDHKCCEDVSDAPTFPNSLDPFGRVYFPVRFVLLTSDSNAEHYHLEDWAVWRQVEILNWGFRRSKFRFGLQNLSTSAVTEINNTELASACNTDACYANPMTCPFYAKLLPYLGTDSSQEVMVLVCNLHYDGESQFPWSSPEGLGTSQYIQIRYGAFATKGNGTRRNGGASLIHEMGHYLGLLHTFENGCNAPGDWVSDTPFTAHQADLNADCASLPKASTCPGRIEPPDQSNFMDYAADECVDHFTPQQLERMKAAVAKYRPKLLRRGVLLATQSALDRDSGSEDLPPGNTSVTLDALRRKNVVFVWFLVVVAVYVALLLGVSRACSFSYARARQHDDVEVPGSTSAAGIHEAAGMRVVPLWMKYHRSHPYHQRGRQGSLREDGGPVQAGDG